MVEVVQPLSIWIQLASAFFTLSGVYGDLLLIRLFLLLAYVMLLVNAALGSPLWGDMSNPGILFVDSLVWAILGIYVHGASLICLILDEKTVAMSDDEAALWRMFYRTGGLSERLFKSIVAAHLEIVEFKPEEQIPTDEHFYVLYTGSVQLEVLRNGEVVATRETVSGQMFDLKFLGMYKRENVFTKHSIACKSINRTKLFRFSRQHLEKMASESLAKGVWQSLLVNNLSFVVEFWMNKEQYVKLSETECDAIFKPLEEWELPASSLSGSGSALKNPLSHLAYYVKNRISLPWPFGRHLTGIRQTLLPPPPQKQQRDSKEFPLPRFHGRPSNKQSLTNPLRRWSSRLSSRRAESISFAEVDRTNEASDSNA